MNFSKGSSIFLILAAIAAGTWWYSTATPKVIITQDSYQYGSTRIWYESAGEEVTVYIGTDGSKKELIAVVPVDLAGSAMPEFKKTSMPTIAMLTIKSGDAGGFFEEWYYIDVLTQDVLKIRNNNGDFVEIAKGTEPHAGIYALITDHCGEGETKQQGQEAWLEDLLVIDDTEVDTPQHILQERRKLTCLNPGGIGGEYDPEPTLDITGVSPDLSLVFFSLVGQHWEEEKSQLFWQDNYSFSVKTQKIQQGDPHNIL